MAVHDRYTAMSERAMSELNEWLKLELTDEELMQKKKEFMERKDVLESDVKVLDAKNDEYYGPREEVKYEVVGGELNRFPGQLLVGKTGAMGYHVPAADRKTNIKMMGRYLKLGCWQNNKQIVRIHKKFRVPRKIEELICVETGANAIPKNIGECREEPRNWWLFGNSMINHTFQYDVVAWESKPNPKNGNTMWRMGYVMNDMATTLRVMVPNGRLYVLKATRVVKFFYRMDGLNRLPFHHPKIKDDRKYYYDMDVPDTDFPPMGSIEDFTDDDWCWEDDVEKMIDIYQTKFIKDTSFPLDMETARKKRRLARGD